MAAGTSNVSKHPSTTPLVAWQPAPPPPKKKKEKKKNAIQKAKERHDRLEDLINEM